MPAPSLDVDKKPAERVRVWLVEKTDKLLHFLVYLQHSDSTGSSFSDPVNVKLLSYGCNPEAAPTTISAFGLEGKYRERE